MLNVETVKTVMSTGERIRQLRERHRLKQIDLANALQVSPQAVSKWEREANEPDLRVLVKLARLLGVSTDFLLGAHENEPGMFPATVFCTSLNRFAKRSVGMSSRELADWTNVIFHYLTDSVLKYDGVPVKYVGDGALCFFSGAAHADRALQAAIRAMQALSEEGLVIALNSGDIYLGLIGHTDYATRDICGDAVNRAFLLLPWVARLCAGSIGVAASTRKQLQGTYRFRRPQKVYLKELREEFAIHAWIGKQQSRGAKQ
jgi:class 3 adenylate cyclase